MDKAAKKRMGFAALAVVFIATLVLLQSIAAQSPSVSYHLITEPIEGVAYRADCSVECHLPLRITFQNDYTVDATAKFQPKLVGGIGDYGFDTLEFRRLATIEEEYDKWVEDGCSPWDETLPINDSHPKGKIRTHDNCTGHFEKVPITRDEWQSFDPENFKFDGSKEYVVDLVGKRSAKLGASRVDAQFCFGDKCTVEYAWWNASYQYRYNLTVGTSGRDTEVFTLNVSGLNGSMDCLQVIQDDTTEVEWEWYHENSKAPLTGDTIRFFADGDNALSIYTKDSCGSYTNTTVVWFYAGQNGSYWFNESSGFYCDTRWTTMYDWNLTTKVINIDVDGDCQMRDGWNFTAFGLNDTMYMQDYSVYVMENMSAGVSGSSGNYNQFYMAARSTVTNYDNESDDVMGWLSAMVGTSGQKCGGQSEHHRLYYDTGNLAGSENSDNCSGGSVWSGKDTMVWMGYTNSSKGLSMKVWEDGSGIINELGYSGGTQSATNYLHSGGPGDSAVPYADGSRDEVYVVPSGTLDFYLYTSYNTLTLQDQEEPEDLFPAWSSPTVETVYQFETVLFNATWTDDNGLNQYWFSSNETGVWINQSTVSFGGLSNYSTHSTSFNDDPGTLVAWRFYADDTEGQENVTSVQTFTVGGVVWGQTSLTLDPANESGPYPGSQVSLIGYNGNTNVQVSCLSGDCGNVTHDFTNGGDIDDTSSNVQFNCTTETSGDFSAEFSVVSDEDTYEHNITVSCTVYAGESTGDNAIDAGIAVSNASGGTVIQDYQVIVADTTASAESFNTYDRYVSSGDQRWLFLYVTDAESASGQADLAPAVYVWENASLTYDAIVAQVEHIIDDNYS